MNPPSEENVAKTLTRVLENEAEALVSAYVFGSLAEGRGHPSCGGCVG